MASKLTERLNLAGEKITNVVGTMYVAILFAVIGIMGVAGALSGNVGLVLIIGAVSGYFLQLVLLPIIIVGQNAASAKSEARSQRMSEEIQALFDAQEASSAARHAHTHKVLKKLNGDA